MQTIERVAMVATSEPASRGLSWCSTNNEMLTEEKACSEPTNAVRHKASASTAASCLARSAASSRQSAQRVAKG